MRQMGKWTGIALIITVILTMIPLSAFSAAGGGAGVLKNSIVLYVGSPVAYVNGAEKRIDPVNLDITPVILKSAEMVPVRFIAESLGGSAKWDQGSKTATILLGGKEYQFKQGSATMRSGSRTYTLEAAVTAYKGRTLVPLDGFVQVVGKQALYERGLIIISNNDIAIDKTKDKALIDEWISKLSFLPVVGSYNKLVSLLTDADQNGVIRISGVYNKKTMLTDALPVQNSAKAQESAAAAASPSEPTADGDTAQGDYSTTNVQVQGVDEGDIVKTDGNYIYQVNKERVVIIKANPPESMKVMAVVRFQGKDLIPEEIYLHGGKLIVIGSSQAYFPLYKEDNGVRKEFYPSRRLSRSSTKALVYDMTDRTNVKLLREVELQGGYVSSRKIGSSLYIVANDNIDYYSIQYGEVNATPSYKDSKVKGGTVTVNYNTIRYFPGAICSNYMMVAGINLDGSDAANVSTYLGAGQNIYASSENLYAAVTNYTKNAAGTGYETGTQIYKFALKDAKATYLCKGTVPGTVLNQFSMDESGSTFRIATTRGDMWASDEGISKNALFVLDSMLTITGKIDDMAPGEKIYSVRFLGDRAYVVTFKTVDPLFVIDLKDPAKPLILGALKIPGYSDYLHPYDENHIIGFGKDTVEIKGQAYYQGIKLALFDVSNVAKPVQLFAEMIGDRGTDSELLRNHKALLFSKEKNLLAFPVTLMEKPDADKKVKADSLEYGQFTFQGAYVYNLDLKTGFKLKGRITHLSNEDYLKAGNNWYDSDRNVQRIIYIGSNLYTLSNGMIKANAITDLKEKGKVTIP